MQDFNSTMRWGDLGKVSPYWSSLFSAINGHLSPVRSRKCIPVSETRRKGRRLHIRFAYIYLEREKITLGPLPIYVFYQDIFISLPIELAMFKVSITYKLTIAFWKSN